MRMRCRLFITFAGVLCGLFATPALSWADDAVSFYRDIAPIFAKHGCNAGSCHGNAQGKGGFKLSLRGENPAQDAATLTGQLPSKRVSTDQPEASYLLRKPSKLVTHEGGEKFTPQSESYQLLLQWITQGAKPDLDTAPVLKKLEVTPVTQILLAPEWEVALQVQAVFADGSTRDVSRWAVYEPSNLLVSITPEGRVTSTHEGETTIIVRYLHLQVPVSLAFVPQRAEETEAPPEPFNFIDEAVTTKLRSLRLQASPLCDDTTFLRRVYFDLLGVPPTSDEARAFLNDPSATQAKREHLVTALLDRPEYGEQWALRWSDLLRNEEKTLDQRGVTTFYEWLRDRFQTDVPLSTLATELLTGEGSTYANGAANYYRALRDPSTRAEATAQVFMGTRLQCAKCHNHPFEQWTQDDYYRFSALFDGVDYQLIGEQHPDKFDKHKFDGEQVVTFSTGGKFQDPRTKQAPQPGFFDPAAPPLGKPEGKERYQELAAWITDPNRPRFAQVQANRIWYHLMGQGIVDPVDDFRATNPPSNPALLDGLAKEFIAQGYRVKPLIKTILLSRTYQTSSAPNHNNAADTRNFSHPRVIRRSAEQLLDAIHHVMGLPTKFLNLPPGQRAGQRAGVPRLAARSSDQLTDDDQFLICFGKPRRLISSETERRQASSLAQVFTLTSGPGLHELLHSPDNFLHPLLSETPQNLLTELFWHILSRPPTPLEISTLAASFTPETDARQNAEDVTWALLNSSEFLLRP